MKVKREELLDALQMVKPGLADKEMIEQSASFAFIDGRVVTYNDEISISCPVGGVELAGVISASELYGLLSRLDDSELELKQEGSEVLIKSDGVEAGFTIQSEIKLPLLRIDKRVKWKELPSDFVEKLGLCIPSCSNDIMGKPILTCINVREDGVVESSDNLRLTYCELGGELLVPTFLIPRRSAEYLVKYQVKEVAGDGSGWAHFRMDDSRTIFSCRVFKDTFPDTTRIIDIKDGIEVKLPETIVNTLDRIQVFSKQGGKLDEEISISMEANKITLKARSEAGWIREKANIRYKGGRVRFLINPVFMKMAASLTTTCVLGVDKVEFSGSDWKHIIALTEGRE